MPQVPVHSSQLYTLQSHPRPLTTRRTIRTTAGPPGPPGQPGPTRTPRPPGTTRTIPGAPTRAGLSQRDRRRPGCQQATLPFRTCGIKFICGSPMVSTLPTRLAQEDQPHRDHQSCVRNTTLRIAPDKPFATASFMAVPGLAGSGTSLFTKRVFQVSLYLFLARPGSPLTPCE